jgi:esterase/lipase superfamily enzyme
VFERVIAPRICQIARRLTLYASARDKALQLARHFDTHRRAGDVGEQIVICPGIDTIDVSQLETDFTGHSYYGDHKSVLSDIYYTMFGHEPGKRFGLKPRKAKAGTYYEFAPER